MIYSKIYPITLDDHHGNIFPDILREMVMLLPGDVINVMVPFLSQYHGVSDDSNVSPVNSNMAIGPYYPRRGHKMPSMMPKNSARPIRPIMQMAVNVNLIEVSKVSLFLFRLSF